jgi:hypothetical protein
MVYETRALSEVGSLIVAWHPPCASGIDSAIAEDPPVLWLNPVQVTPKVR